MLKYCLIIVVVLKLLPIYTIPIDGTDSNEKLIEYTKLAVYMTKRFLSLKTHTLLIREWCRFNCTIQEHYQSELLSNMVIGLNGEFGIEFFMDYFRGRLRNYNIFIVDSFEAFIDIRYSFPEAQKERFIHFFILLTRIPNNEEDHKNTLHDIFRSCLGYKIRNVVIMSKSYNGNDIRFYAYNPFNKDKRQNEITFSEINRYENGTLQNQFLFPDLTNDYHGYLMNVSAHEMPSLLSFNGDVNNETHSMESDRLGGIEGDILKLVADALNFKIRLNFPKEISVIHRVYYSKGCFGDLDTKRAEIAIGGFSSTQRNSEKYSYSVAYHTTPFVFVIPIDLIFGPIEQLLNPLCPSVWIIVLILLTVLFICTKLVQVKPEARDLVFDPKNKKPIYSILVIFLGYVMPRKLVPKRDFGRYILASWLLLSFHVRIGYQGQTYNNLRFMKRMPVPQTVSNLKIQDYSLLASTYSELYLFNITRLMPNTTKYLDMLQNSTTPLTAVALMDSLAHYNYINSNTSTLTYVKEAIIPSYPFVMYFQKYSMLSADINRKLTILSDAGITSYFARKHDRSKFLSIKNRNSQFMSKLTNENLLGLYIVSSVMFLISIFVFTLEVFTRKSRRLQKIMDRLNSF